MIKHLEALRELDLPEGRYAVFGSGPLAIRGIRENVDLDVLVAPEVWDRLCAAHAVERRPGRPDMIHIGPIQVLEVGYADWSPGIDDGRVLIEEAETFDGLPFVRLEHLLECKRMMSGEKHAQDVERILSYVEDRGEGVRAR